MRRAENRAGNEDALDPMYDLMMLFVKARAKINPLPNPNL